MIGGLNGLKGLDPKRRGAADAMTFLYGVRLRSVVVAPTSWAMRTIEIYDEPDFTGNRITDLTSSWIASASSTYPNPEYSAANLFDSNTETIWSENTPVAAGVTVAVVAGIDDGPLPWRPRSVRWLSYGGNRSPAEVAVDFKFLSIRNGLATREWRQVETLVLPTNTATWYGWASL